ncbi:MAG: hypothetical protein AAFU77_11850 [Myxococcota bacterium]
MTRKDTWPLLPIKVRNQQVGGDTHSLTLLPNGQLYTVSHYGYETRLVPGCDDLDDEVSQQLDMKYCSAMDVSSDGVIAVLGGDEIVVKEILTGKVRKRWDAGSAVWGISISADRKHLVVSREPNIFDLYLMVNYSLLHSVTEGERCAQVRFVNNEWNDILLATSFQAGSVLYNADPTGFPNPMQIGLDTDYDVIGSLEVSPNKKWVAYSDAAMRIGEIQDWGGTPPKRIVIPDPRGPSVNVQGMLNHSWSRPFWLSDTRLATSPPGGQKGLPSSGLNPETFIFDIPSGEIVAQLEVEKQVRDGFAMDRERSILYGSCMNGDILGWDVSSVL